MVFSYADQGKSGLNHQGFVGRMPRRGELVWLDYGNAAKPENARFRQTSAQGV